MQTARRGVDDIAGTFLAPRQIPFFAWSTLNEQKRVTFAERRGTWRVGRVLAVAAARGVDWRQADFHVRSFNDGERRLSRMRRACGGQRHGKVDESANLNLFWGLGGANIHEGSDRCARLDDRSDVRPATGLREYCQRAAGKS